MKWKIRILYWVFVIIFVLNFFGSGWKSSNIQNFFDKYFTNIFILVITIAFILTVVILFKSSKKRKEQIDKILTEVLPQKAVIVDVLIIKDFGGTDDTARFFFYPILKDFHNNDLYVSLGKYNFGIYKYDYSAWIGSYLKFQLKNSKKENVNIGDNATYYLKHKLDKFSINGDIIVFDNISYKYYGKIGDSRIISQVGSNLVFNVSQDNFLELLNKITPFEGIVSFDE